MQQIKNIAILATALIFMVIFWVMAQLFYSFNLIAEYKSPEISSRRGYEDAISDFRNNYAVFKSINGEYPFVTEEQLGVVFEEKIRSVYRDKVSSDQGISLDQIISELTEKHHFNQAKAKRARVAAHIRTKATHAQWQEFDLADVKNTLLYVEEFIRA